MIRPRLNHPWDLSAAEAKALQRKLAARVVAADHRLEDVRYVAGVDVGYDAQDRTQLAAAVVLDAKSLGPVESSVARAPVIFPYIPGLFSFREMPAIVKALIRLSTRPDLMVCDGHGMAHPRRFGLACHLGVLFEIPTIGCGKTKLSGDADEPGQYRGDRAPMKAKGDVIGTVLRTQHHIKPVYVSVGHLISLKTACQWILKLTPRFRLPETTRQADQLVKVKKRDEAGLADRPAPNQP